MTDEEITMNNVFADIQTERHRQDRKWGEQNHDPFVWLAILGEEKGEADKAALEWQFGHSPISDYRKELVESAAVAVAAIECLDRFAEDPRVYLAGPIMGCSDSETFDWRAEAEKQLSLPCFNPAKERDFRTKLSDDCMTEIVEPDKRDILRSSFVLAHCWDISCGTSMEILFAWEHKKRIVTIWPHGKPCSAWIIAHSSVIVPTLDQACEFINGAIH